jgi:hypothetical protein
MRAILRLRAKNLFYPCLNLRKGRNANKERKGRKANKERKGRKANKERKGRKANKERKGRKANKERKGRKANKGRKGRKKSISTPAYQHISTLFSNLNPTLSTQPAVMYIE